MYEEGKKLEFKDDRQKRIAKLKKMIIGLVITLIAIPTLLCIVLVVRVVTLQGKVNDLLDEKNKSQSNSSYTEQSAGSSTEDGTTSSNEEQSTGDKSTEGQSTEEQSTEEQSTEEQSTDKPVVIEPLPDGKYAYLTFDDGPSANTMQILDILDNYGVKATFFVNGHTGDVMEERYKAIVDRGHAIGIHTYTHDYDTVYGGLAKFEQEIVSLRNYIKEVTGKDTTLFRFPGGSSNSRVDDIKPYIQWLNDNGYSYWDWNSSSEDAAGTKPSAQQIVENCLRQDGYKNLVILMHDLKPKDTTVEALPALIEALQARGYEIIAIDERSTPVQHRKLQ